MAAAKKPKFGSSTTALEVLKDIDLTGKTILITGATTGIGRETTRALVLKGAHVVMANRNKQLSEEFRDELYKEAEHAKIDIIQLELSSLQSIREAANEFLSNNWPLHVLILNAGVVWVTSKTTTEGYESTFGINHLGHFYLTYLLLDKLRESAPSRLVIVSSKLHANTGIKSNAALPEKLATLIPPPDTSTFNLGLSLYAYSKLCNVLFALKFHRLEHENGINVYVLHPGVIPGTGLSSRFGILSTIFSYVAWPFTKSLEQGAATTVYCAASPYVSNESGNYYADCHESEKDLHTALARDESLQDALWEKSVEFIQKFESEKSRR
uniref:Uncharacterized protein n=1 Tax=Acrobeloides nanus TaxID=290746 RepID=A0A914CWX8_9BILA